MSYTPTRFVFPSLLLMFCANSINSCANSINSTVCVLFIWSLVLCVHDVDERITYDQDDHNHDDYDDLDDDDYSNATDLQN